MPRWIHELRPTLALALPIVLGQLSQMLIGITDSMMIGRVGTVELAAASFSGAVFGVIYVACLGLMQSGAVLIARAHGAGSPTEAGMWLKHSRWLAWTVGIGLAGLMSLSLLVADRFGQPPEVVAVMGPFYLLVATSLIPAMLFQVDRQFAEAVGRPWEPLVIMLAGAAFNVLLNWMFIYGRLGAPAWGLSGAGVATLASRVATVAVLRWRLGHAGFFATAMAAARTSPVTKSRVREMLALGVPMGATLFFEAGAFSGSAVLAGWLGTVSLAAHQIAISCASMAFMVPLGVSIALGMRTGAAIGAGRRDRVRPMAVGAVALTCATATVSTVAFVAGGELIAGSFTRDAAVVTLAARVLAVAALFQLFDGMQVVFAGSLRGMADVRAPLAAAFLAYWVLALPGGWFFGVHGGHGLIAVWMSLAAGLAVAALLLGWRLSRLTR